ncbi:hypothetical protein MY3296_008762 [Beauveria thailandica]
MGYDVSDYRAIHPPYGDISDVDTLRDKLHERGMKLVLDLVMNHTSDQHEWFQRRHAVRRRQKELLNAVGADRGELSMIFHFEFMDLGHGINGKLSPKSLSIDEMKKTLDKWQRLIRAPSAASRTNAPNHRVASAKPIAIFMVFQAGTPFFPHTSPAHFSPTGQGNTMLYTTVSARKNVFVYGDFALVDNEAHDKVLAYKRTAANGDCRARRLQLFRRRGDVWGLAGTTDVPPREVIVSATGKTKADLGSKIELGPYEAIALLQ